MAREFKEKAHLKTNQALYNAGWDHIFNKKDKEHYCFKCEKEADKDELDGVCCHDCVSKDEE